MENLYKLGNSEYGCGGGGGGAGDGRFVPVECLRNGDFRDGFDGNGGNENGVQRSSSSSVSMSDLVKAQIASHPKYPTLVSAYIECRKWFFWGMYDKVGAPPEIAMLLEEIGRENLPVGVCGEIGADPELDEFMDSYCEVLIRYKEELSKPFDEAATFLSSIEMQLSNLCTGTSTATVSKDPSGSLIRSLEAVVSVNEKTRNETVVLTGV
ncbi:hypothetical protein ACLOJK_026476 [Asimina triloba]